MKSQIKHLLQPVRDILDSTDKRADESLSDCSSPNSFGVIFVAALSLLGMFYLFRTPQTGQILIYKLLSFCTSGERAVELIGLHPRLLYLLWWACGSLLLYLLIPLCYIRFVLKKPLQQFGFTLQGYFSHLKLYLFLFMPVAVGVVIVSFLPSFQAYYPLYRTPASTELFILWELVYFSQFFALEFFYRGFLLHGLKWRYGSASLWIMVFPYFMIHFGKPWPEAAGAFIAGVALGLLSLRSGSIAGGVTVHISVAMLMDLLAAFHRGWLS